MWTGFIAELSPPHEFPEFAIFDTQFALRTARLLISKAKSPDMPALAAIWADADVRRYLGGSISRDEALARVDSRVAAGQLCAVRLYGNDRIIGCVVLEEVRPLELEVSYLFNVDAWGYGYATESVSAVVEKIRDRFNGYEVVAKTQAANLPSRRLLSRLGFRMEQEIIEFGEPQAIFRQRL
ncbi:MAG TPA: GNAT family N-acetyltransferase [Casimicrobium huifangae]|uniref:GNAT family N-acetyltransferase n=1 Tax=Casimicrobium huifangae TaxID=2591109 RepID=UPI002353A080|nr:GNAT family N-acetyltransferase [Casimicrobium huifangae]HOB01126.1 GNAT family N-acetyltransferase [Casimicrobium huifangae]HQA32345.1 GNAT family N-acetyltransferase [Casimicrobium huifangae]HQD63800.1 GNAT family N-acetyltransferase [Casimicrobium huifangae]